MPRHLWTRILERMLGAVLGRPLQGWSPPAACENGRRQGRSQELLGEMSDSSWDIDDEEYGRFKRIQRDYDTDSDSFFGMGVMMESKRVLRGPKKTPTMAVLALIIYHISESIS